MTFAPQRLRIGAVSYLNTKPLVYGLSEAVGSYANLSFEVPSKLADDLETDQLDIGLIPVIEYLRNPNYRIASDACIACEGPVWSVRVVFRKRPEQVRTLAIDEGSRTSVVLASILLYEKFGVLPQTVPFPLSRSIDECSEDAILVIGDRAMHLTDSNQHFVEDWDLGQIWHEHTGLPFVFAVWVASVKAQQHPKFDDLCRAFEQQRDLGLANAEKIAQECASQYRLSESQIAAYLTRFLTFKAGEREREALALYGTKANDIGLLKPNKTNQLRPTVSF
jgi:chorismate dehydratase